MNDARDIRILCTNGVRGLFTAFRSELDRAAGRKLEITFDTANVLKDRILGGERFDIAVLTPPAIEELVNRGKLARGSVRDIAQSGVAVAVARGAPRPDISTVEAFKRALLNARAIAYTTKGASGIYFGGLIQRLGLAEALEKKSLRQEGGLVGERLLSGEVDIAVQQMSELLAVAGIDIVGPLPAEVQNITKFSLALPPDCGVRDAAEALLAFLASPTALAAARAQGLEPLV
jgi:molybdate transport system substrate-binding protein